MIQAQHAARRPGLASTATRWPRIDPRRHARPFVHGDVGTKGVAPYAKHPTYPLLLAGFDLIGGYWAMLAGGPGRDAGGRRAGGPAGPAPGPAPRSRASLWLVGVGQPAVLRRLRGPGPHPGRGGGGRRPAGRCSPPWRRRRTACRGVVAAWSAWWRPWRWPRCCAPRPCLWAPPWPWPPGWRCWPRQVRLRRAVVVAVAAVAGSARGLRGRPAWPPAPSSARPARPVPNVGGQLVGRPAGGSRCTPPGSRPSYPGGATGDAAAGARPPAAAGWPP